MQKDTKVIVAVSGGVDSVVMLHMLVNGSLPGFEHVSSANIIVAHVDHGIRAESAHDAEFVRNLASEYKLTFESTQLHLGDKASEELARSARYTYLESLARQYSTHVILLAHHKQDIIETAILNIIRGTGRSGLSSLQSRKLRYRPLLHLKKADIIQYANDNHLKWVEDSTNHTGQYSRSILRKILEPKLDTPEYQQFATNLQKINSINTDINQQIAIILQYKIKRKNVLDRSLFVGLDHAICCELIRHVLNELQVKNIDKILIERLVIAIKAGKPGSYYDVDKNIQAYITKRSLRFLNRTTRSTYNV